MKALVGRWLLVLLVGGLMLMGTASAAFADDGSQEDERGLKLTAQSSLTTQDTTADYTIGEEYNGFVGYFNVKHVSFSVPNEKSHIYVRMQTESGVLELNIFDGNGNSVSDNGNTVKVSNSKGDQFTYSHSCNLDAGSYVLDISNNRNYGGAGTIKLLITAEPIVSLERPSIVDLSSSSANCITTAISPVPDALSYEYQFGTSSDFSDATTVAHPGTSYTASGLAGDAYYYVRVRPFTVYNDGLAVYGNWSRAKSIHVAGLANKVTIGTASKSVKYKKLKKASQTFQIEADDEIGADLTFERVSVTAAAKKRIGVNASTGVVTVKKGLRKGTFKLNVRVTAAATGQYGAASASKVIKVKVK